MTNSGILFKKNPIYEKCPSCNVAGVLRKSHSRNLTEKLIKRFTPYSVYRCKKCGWRGYRSKMVLTIESLKNALVYVVLVVIVAFVVLQVLKRFV